MSCEEFQMKIWAGQVDYATSEHLETCEACQREHQEVRAVLGGIRDLDDTPQPTGSLQPSPSLIRTTVRKNRLRRTLRSSSVAAGITILIGAGVGYGLHHANTQPQFPAGLGECKCAAPIGTEDSSTASRSSVAQKQALTPQWIEVQTDTPETKAIANFLKSYLRPEEVRHVTVVRFEQDGTYGQDIVGTVTLDVDLQPGAVTPYAQGRQEAVVELSHLDGGALSVVNGRYEFDLKQMAPSGLLTLWVQALQNRNGAEEFRLFTPALKQRVRSDYRKAGWSIGMSKPNPNGYNVLHISDTNDSEKVYDLEMTMPGSDPYPAQLTMRKYQTGWYIERVVYQGGSPANNK